MLLAAAQMNPPPEPLAGMLRAEVWNDVRLNAMIGNGNEIAARWMNYGGPLENSLLLHILDLTCRSRGADQRCRFDLLRDGGAIFIDGRSVVDRISCRATFRLAGEGRWSIPHLPPGPRGGHSRTTLRCRWAPRPR